YALASRSIFTLSLPDALPSSHQVEEVTVLVEFGRRLAARRLTRRLREHFGVDEAVAGRDERARCLLLAETIDALARFLQARGQRSEEHTSELQSRENLVCRLL